MSRIRRQLSDFADASRARIFRIGSDGGRPSPGAFGVVVVAFILVALLLGIAFVAGGAIADASPPGGMVGVSSENINSDLPAQSPMGQEAESLADAGVYTSEHADTLEVVVTSPGRAKTQYTGGQLNGEGPIAIVLVDDHNSSAREIAIPAAELESILGHRPTAVFGVHQENSEDAGEDWSAPIEYDDGYAVFRVESFSSNTVTFSGGVSIDGQAATDGFTANYEIGELASVDNYEIEVTGVENRAPASTSGIFTEGETHEWVVGGNVVPENAEITLTGRYDEVTRSETVSDGSTLQVNGNGDPTGEEVTIHGAGSSTSQSATVSDGQTIDVGGNLAPTGESVTLTGNENSNRNDQSGSVSNGGSDSINVGGNLDPQAPGGGDPNLDISVNMDPQAEDSHKSADDGVQVYIGSGDKRSVEARILRQEASNPISGIEIDWHDQFNDGTNPVTFDLRMHTGPPNENIDGTLVKSGVSRTPSAVKGTTETIVFDEAFDTGTATEATLELHWQSGQDYLRIPTAQGGVDYVIDEGGSTYSRDTEAHITPLSGLLSDVTVNADAGGSETFSGVTDGESRSSSISMSSGTSSLSASIPDSGTGASVSYTVEKEDRYVTEDPSVTIDGSTVSHTGKLYDGQTASGSVGLSTGTHTASVSSIGPDPVVDVDWVENEGTEDPSVDIGGSTASYTGVLQDGETATETLSLAPGSHTVSIGTASGPNPSSVDVDFTEVHETEDPSVSIGGTEVASHTGVLSEGQTISEPVTLDRGSNSFDVSTGSEVGVNISYDEVAKTIDPVVNVNGAETSEFSTIEPGQTVSLSTNPDWIQEGTNTVNLSLYDPESTGPIPQANLHYAHDADGATREVEYAGETWSERYNVSNTWVSETQGAEMTLELKSDRVIGIRDLEQRTNGGQWESISETDYELNGTTLTAKFGDVPADTTIDVRVNATKVRTHNGQIKVLEPTTEGVLPETKFEFVEWNETSYIDVGGTVGSNNTHYAGEKDFDSDVFVEYTADGSQRIMAPDAPVGGTMQLATQPLEVDPETGHVEVEMQDPDADSPIFQLRPGSTTGDRVDIGWYNTISGKRYVLESVSTGREVGVDVAESPVWFGTTDDEETYTIVQRDAESSSDRVPVGTGRESTAPDLGVPGWAMFVLVFVGIVGLYVAGRRFGDEQPPAQSTDPDDRSIGRIIRANPLLVIGAPIIAYLALELLTPGLIVVTVFQAIGGAIASTFLSEAVIALFIAVGFLLAIWGIDQVTATDLPRRVWLVTGGLTIVYVIETIAPGTILGSLGTGLETVAPLLILGGLYFAWQWWQSRGEPDQEVVLNLRSDGGDDSSEDDK